MNRPNDAQVFIDPSYYKLGRHGKPYYWREGEWLSISKEAERGK
jgi:hypothetical protein